MSFTETYLAEARAVLEQIDPEQVERLARHLAATRDGGGRLFVVGVGGGAGHASHAVADLRKVAGIEAYAPSDNVSELTARSNDEGWETTYEGWLEVSKCRKGDALLVFSVGGGDIARGVSVNLVRAVDHARKVGAVVLGVVGRDGGHTASVADACVIIPIVEPRHVTAHTESFQALVWHLLVSHPMLAQHAMKWESTR